MSASPGCRSRAALVPLLGVLLALGACGEGGSSPDTNDRLFVFLENLAPISGAAGATNEGGTGESELEYALWREDSDGSAPKLLERFSARNGVVNLSLAADDIDSIATLFVTLERRGEPLSAPSRTALLGGDMLEGRSVLSTDHPRAFGTGFEDANGTFRLATPTSLDEGDFDLGLWWYDIDGAPVQSLFLPDLPQGWLYEGWILSGAGSRSTGKFADPARFDLDAGGASAGTIEPPPFPGQDYVFDPFAITGTSVAITIEPNPDNAIGPFGLRLLFDQVVEGVRVNQPMENVVAARLPRGLVSTNRLR